MSAAAATCDIVLSQGAQCPTPRQLEHAAPASPARAPILVSGFTAMAEAAEGNPAFSMQINLSFEAAARAGAGAAQPASTLTPTFAAVKNLLFEGGLACSGGQQQGLSPSPTPSPSPSPSSCPPPADPQLSPGVLLDALSFQDLECSRNSPSPVRSPRVGEWLVMHSAVEHSVAAALEPAADSELLLSGGNGGEEPGSGSTPWSQWLSPLAPVTGAAAAVVVHVDARGATAHGQAPLTLRCSQTKDNPRQVAPAAPSQALGPSPGIGVGQTASAGAAGCGPVEHEAPAPVRTNPQPCREALPFCVRQPAHDADPESAGANLRAAHAGHVPGPCPAPEPCTPCAQADPTSGPSPAEPSHGPCHAAQSSPTTEHAGPGPRHYPAAATPEPCSAAPRPPHAAASVREAHALYKPRAEDPAHGTPLSLAPTHQASPWQPAKRAELPTPGTPAAGIAAATNPTGRVGPWPPAAHAGGRSVRGPQAGQPHPAQQPPVASEQRAHVPRAAAGGGPLPAPWPRQEDFAIKALRARGGAAREGGAAAAVPERVPAVKQPRALAAQAKAELVHPAAMRVAFNH